MIMKLISGVSGTTSIDIREDGNIIGIAFMTDGALGGNVELSFNSTPSYLTNDVTGTIITTPAGLSAQMFLPINEPVQAGERLFLHQNAANNTVATIITDAKRQPATGRRGR